MTKSKTNDSKLPKPTHFIMFTVVFLYICLTGIILTARLWQPDWTLGGIYIGLFFGCTTIFKTSFIFWHPDLAWRRVDVVSGAKIWDGLILAILAMCILPILYFAIMGFDEPVINLGPPDTKWLVGLVMMAGGWMFFTLSSFWNPFFETMVRIQTDEGHQVMDKGPYSIIRHPGYVGFIASFLATPLLLPSTEILWLSFIATGLIVTRTAYEDHTLQNELPGYTDYVSRVRHRLIPGVW